MEKQIYQQTQLQGNIPTDGVYFVIDMLDPVSGKYKTYKVTSAQLGAMIQNMSKSCCTFTIKTSLTSAQILNLNTTPVVLVPAAGTGTIIQPLSFLLVYTYGTAAYDTHTTLQVVSNGNNNIVYSSIGILSSSVNTLESVPTGGTNTSSTISDIVNQSVDAYVTAGNPLTGDGTLVVYTTFKVLTA